MIPQSFIAELLSRLDIVEVVGRFVQLKKAGANFQGLCPFHGEKTPSFSVSPTKQFYHCFGCGVHGSAIGFVMEHQGLSYVDAIKELARTLGLEVPEEKGANAEQARRTPDILETLALAAKFYKARLKDDTRAIDYLKGRGVSGQTAAKFALGFAPDSWHPLEAAVPDYNAKALEEAGLVIVNENRYDRFRDRVMFPIRNPRGQVIGFGGRVLDKGEPKYLNSPETPVFVKGRELYGLFEAREALRKENCAIVVEGYMDVVMLSQYGVDNALATLGTATTPDHLRKLMRVVDRVVFSFDGDGAGRRAAWRALETALPVVQDTQRIEFLFLPPEHDPDTYVQAHGLDGWQQALSKAEPISNFLITKLSSDCDLNEPEGRARLLALAKPLLANMAAPALRMQILHRLAQLSQVSVQEVNQIVAGPMQRPSSGFAADSAARGARSQGQSSPSGDGYRKAGPNGFNAGFNAGFKKDFKKDFNSRGFGGGRDGAARYTRQANPAMGFTPRSGLPELDRRIRLLSLMHLGLAAEALSLELEPLVLSDPLRAWLSVCADFYQEDRAGLMLDARLEMLKAYHPEHQSWIDACQADYSADYAGLAGLGDDALQNEAREVLANLRAVSQRALMQRLSNSQDPDDQVKFRELLKAPNRDTSSQAK